MEDGQERELRQAWRRARHTHTEKKITGEGGAFTSRTLIPGEEKRGKTVCFGLGKLRTGSVQPLPAFTL